MTLYREIGHRLGEADVLTTLGDIYGDIGNDDAGGCALPCSHDLSGDRPLPGQAVALIILGLVRRNAGAYEAAADLLRQALMIYAMLFPGIAETGAVASIGVVRNSGDNNAVADQSERADDVSGDRPPSSRPEDALADFGVAVCSSPSFDQP